jgi:hypothetical protein
MGGQALRVSHDLGRNAGPLAAPHIGDDERLRRWKALRAESEKLLLRLRAFDPDEPRDEQGRWTDGGGSDGGGSGSGAAGSAKPASPRESTGGAGAGAASGPYTVTSASAAKGGGDVARVYALNAKTRSEYQRLGWTPVAFHELKSNAAGKFHDAITAAKAANPFGASVDIHDAAEYAFMKTFLTPDGKAGFAVRDDGNIVSVFKHPDSTIKGFARSALTLATQVGGRKLDAFDTVLPHLYSESGFRAVARIPFDPKFAPPGWSKEQFGAFNGGKPDVVFMIYDPEHAAPYKPGDGWLQFSYDGAVAAQTEALKALDAAHEAKPAAVQEATPAPTTAMTQTELFPGMFPPIPEPKAKADVADFDKAKVEIDRNTKDDPAKTQKFLTTWNDRIGEAPEEFKNEFLGGIPATMNVKYDTYGTGEDADNTMELDGALLDADGRTIGSYTRTIDFRDNKAVSSYFVLNNSKTGGGVGKQVLKANVEMYQKLGLDSVEVHANIDVGGYAWAKYGYVPTDWYELQSNLEDRLNEMAGGGDYEPSSWDEMSSDQQQEVYNAWRESTEDDFIRSEQENYVEDGRALDDQKQEMADEAKWDDKWVTDGLAKWRSDTELTDIPFTDEEIARALSVDYRSRHGDGREDPDVTIDESRLPEATRDKLTDDMRSEIEGALVTSFNDTAERDAPDRDVPTDNIADYQSEYWDSMKDRDKYRWAVDNDKLPTGGSEGTGEISSDDADHLRGLLGSSDPKAIWDIADAPGGKELLLGSDWNGELNFHDKDSMDRFNAYVGKTKPAAASA